MTILTRLLKVFSMYGDFNYTGLDVLSKTVANCQIFADISLARIAGYIMIFMDAVRAIERRKY